MGKNFWFKARFSWGSSFSLLDDSEIASLCRAIWTMEETGEEMELTGKAAFLWPLISSEIQQDMKDRENGKKGGRPPKKENPAENPGINPPLTEKSKAEQSKEEQSRSEPHTRTPRKKKGDTPGFEAFYAAYPRHDGKADALKAWNKLAPDDQTQKIILSAIQKQRESPDWKSRELKFIPMPASWLNGRRWEDELQPAKPAFAGIDTGVNL